MTVSLASAVEAWSAVALEKGWAGQWVEGAILPREMVFFLARCEELGIERVIESGRQDGFSTLILGEFIARRPGVTAYSIDFEDDAERARRCRERLKAYPALNLLTGNANRLIPATVRREPAKPTAVLVDGPKGFWALSLMLSSLQYPGVRIISLHNLSRGTGYREYLEGFGSEPLFLEDFKLSSPAWTRLGDAERERLDVVAPGRSKEPSTLGLLHVDDAARRKAARALHPRFRLFQPPLVRLGWSLGLDGPTDALFSLSHRLWRS